MSKNNKINFTGTTIKRLPIPEKSISYYKDTQEKGLQLYITPNGVITFFLRKFINGRDERFILGNFSTMTVEKARKEFIQVRALLAKGINPNDEKTKLKDETTFEELFNEYMERYSKKQKRSWVYDEREVNKFLSHWFNRKISTITKQEIQKLQERVRDENGLYQANRLLERIRAIYNKGIEWGWEGVNPTNNIKKFKEKARDRFIQPDELPRLFEALEEANNPTIRDYVYISLLTGARKSNVLSMQWNEISWERKEWRIPETKNGEPVVIPLVDKAIEILEVRKENSNSKWVFPSPTSKTGHLADPKRAWNNILKKAEIEDLRIHDIRRTLGSYQAITGASLQVIGKSLGHKSQNATQIYSRLNNDPVRQSIEKATDVMFDFGKAKER